MSLETELKFFCSDLEEVRKNLRQIGAKFESRFFEENIVFDTPERSLRCSGILLRLRRTDKNVLCLKQPMPDKDREVKSRREIETKVEDFVQMRIILEGLGYQAALSYEKVREKWQLDRCTVCLDILPFANFVELEAQQEDIYGCASDLRLKTEDSTIKSYHELNREYQKQQGLVQDESFVFAEPTRSELIYNLHKDNFQA
jgi:adenylate cyclase class 2